MLGASVVASAGAAGCRFPLWAESHPAVGKAPFEIETAGQSGVRPARQLSKLGRRVA